MPLNTQETADTVSVMNIKAFGSADSMLPINAAQNTTTHLKRIELIAENGLQAWQNRLVSPDPMESASARQILGAESGTADRAASAALVSKLIDALLIKSS